MRDQRVKQLHNDIKLHMQEKAEMEEQKQKQTEINRQKIFQEKIGKFDEYILRRQEGEQRQIQKNKEKKEKKLQSMFLHLEE